MYSIIVFSGGYYRFDEFREYIEDIGGLVIRRDSLTIRRGIFFLRNELRALCVVPEDEVENVTREASRIKGEIEIPVVVADAGERIQSCFRIHHMLAGSDWKSADEIENLTGIPADGILDTMVEMELLERRHEGEYEYRIPVTEDWDRLKGG